MKQQHVLAALALVLISVGGVRAWAGEEPRTPAEIITEIRTHAEQLADPKIAEAKKVGIGPRLSRAKDDLVKLGAPAVSEIIKTIKKDTSESLRLHLLLALYQVQDRDLVGALPVTELTKVIQDGNEPYPVRYWALKNVASSPDRRAVKPVLDALKNTRDIPALRLAIETVGRRNLPKGGQQLLPLLKHKAAQIRIDAVTALENMKATGQVPALAELLKDPDPYVLRAAIQAIEKLTGAKFGIQPADDDAAVQKKIAEWLDKNKDLLKRP